MGTKSNLYTDYTEGVNLEYLIWPNGLMRKAYKIRAYSFFEAQHIAIGAAVKEGSEEYAVLCINPHRSTDRTGLIHEYRLVKTEPKWELVVR
jgi:hypothetical protein